MPLGVPLGVDWTAVWTRFWPSIRFEVTFHQDTKHDAFIHVHEGGARRHTERDCSPRTSMWPLDRWEWDSSLHWADQVVKMGQDMTVAIILVWLCVWVWTTNRSGLTLIYYTDRNEMHCNHRCSLQLFSNCNTRMQQIYTRNLFSLLSGVFLFFLLLLQVGDYLLPCFLFVLLSVHVHRWARRSWHLIQESAHVTSDVHWALLVHLNERVFLRDVNKHRCK